MSLWQSVCDYNVHIMFDRVEIEVYKTLDPGVRVIILKALCDIRVEVLLLRNFLRLSKSLVATMRWR